MPNYPASFDSLTNPASTDLLTSPSHSLQHATENDILEALEVHAGLSGTSFPGSPSTGARFRRTDRNIDYFYDGTRWLSDILYVYNPIIVTATALPFTVTVVGAFRAQVPFAGVYDLWLEDFQAAFHVVNGTDLSASHKWVATLVKEPAATTVATITVDSGAEDTWRNSGQIAIDALVGTTNFSLYISVTKTGTPGNFYFLPTLTYRLVG